MADKMTLSPAGDTWIRHSEGLVLVAKDDNGECSIGIGHRGVPPGTVWTEAQAEAAYADDKAAAERIVNALVAVPLTQGQFDALVDFTFNLGAWHLQTSTLLDELNKGMYDDVPAQLMRWDHIGQDVSAGLEARRKGDVILWNGGNPLEETV